MKRRRIVTGILIALALCLLVSIFSSELPDGMEMVMEKLRISRHHQKASQSADFSPLPEYRFPRINSPFASTALAAFIGMAVVFGVMVAIGTLLRKYKGAEKGKTNKQMGIKG
ncbi:MAG: PDGLE domain-containing protein [Acidobacteriota bacterium]